MDTLSTDEIHDLLTTWHERMLQRDEEIRQEIEAGLHELTLQAYGEHCESTADVLQSLLEVVTVPSYDGPQSDGYERQTYSKVERQRAYEEASWWIDGTVVEDDFDFLPVLEQEVSLGSLDELTKRTLIRDFLWSAMETYRTKRDLSAGHTRLRPRGTRKTVAGVATSTGAPKTTTHLISEAWKAYVTQQQSANKKAWLTEPPEKAQIMMRNITGLLGDVPVESLTFEDVERYQRFEQKCPRGGRNMKVEYKGKTVQELEKMDVPDGDKPSSKTVNDKLAPLRALLKMCHKRRWIEVDLGDDLRVASGDKVSRQPWTDEEVRIILDPINIEEHTGFGSPSGRTDYLPWLITLAAYTGARRDELLQLRVIDVVENDPKSAGIVPVLMIVAHEFRGVKTKASERKIPIHPDLSKLGLMELVKRRKAKGRTFLLDHPAGRRSREQRGKASVPKWER